jgi:hypothetical protein
MVINAISRWYPSRFPKDRHDVRPLWRRADYPIVLPNGWPVPAWRIWPILAEAGDLTEEKDGETVIALAGDKLRFEAEVGFGTVKIVVGPFDDLHQIRAAHEAAMARLVAAAEQVGAMVLGYGIQPATIVHPGLITKRPMYTAMHEAAGIPWLTFAITAADQLRVGVARDELPLLLNLGAFYAPMVTAFCANSPIFKGADGYHCSGRDQLMSTIAGGHPRYGLHGSPYASIHDMIVRFARMPFLLQLEDAAYTPYSGSFLDHAEAAQAAGTATSALVEAYLFHESLIWPSARAHVEDGTLSMRAACQQPWPDHMVASALNLAIIESGWALHDFFHTYISPPVAPRVRPGIRQPPDPLRARWDSWPKLQAYSQQPIRYGMQGREPFTGYLEGALQVCEDTLVRRGLGEEVYLAPLWRRLAARACPAQPLRRLFHRKGMDGLLDAAKVRL